MTEMRTKIYLGGFLLMPALVVLVMLTLFSFNLYVFLTMVLLFSFGVVLGPPFLEGEAR